MGDEESGGMVKGTLEAATGLVKAVPIYEDAIQPVAKQVGKSLETVGKLVNVALAPVGLLVWGYDKCEEFIKTKVADRLKNTPPEDIITPKPNVAGPAIEALRYTGHEESLSDMYANLLASAMDRKTAGNAHPAFVEIIKQLTPDEAKLMAFLLEAPLLPILTVRAKKEAGGVKDIAVNVSLFGVKAELEDPGRCPAYLDNLGRLGLVEIPTGLTYSDPVVYYELENSPDVVSLKQTVESIGHVCNLKFGIARTTPFGKQFGAACVSRR